MPHWRLLWLTALGLARNWDLFAGGVARKSSPVLHRHWLEAYKAAADFFERKLRGR